MGSNGSILSTGYLVQKQNETWLGCSPTSKPHPTPIPSIGALRHLFYCVCFKGLSLFRLCRGASYEKAFKINIPKTWLESFDSCSVTALNLACCSLNGGTWQFLLFDLPLGGSSAQPSLPSGKLRYFSWPIASSQGIGNWKMVPDFQQQMLLLTCE